MAGTWLGEQFDSRPGVIAFRELQSTRRYAVGGTENQDDVITLAASNVPAFVSVGGANQFIREIKYNPKGGGQWEVLAQYGFTRPSWELSGDSGGGSSKIIRALQTIGIYRCTNSTVPLPNYRNQINVTPEGIEGVDIVIPKDDYTVTQKYQLSALSGTYLDTLRKMTGRTNDAPFTLAWQDQEVYFEQEECLYMGRTFKQTSTSEVEISHKFSGQSSRFGGTVTTASFVQPSAMGTVTIEVQLSVSVTFNVGDTVYISTQSPTVTEHGIYTVVSIPDSTHLELEFTDNDGASTPGTNIAAGAFVSLDEVPISIGTSGPITKRGWHYLWTANQASIESGGRVVIPKFAVVQKVYRTGSFALLGL